MQRGRQKHIFPMLKLGARGLSSMCDGRALRDRCLKELQDFFQHLYLGIRFCGELLIAPTPHDSLDTQKHCLAQELNRRPRSSVGTAKANSRFPFPFMDSKFSSKRGPGCPNTEKGCSFFRHSATSITVGTSDGVSVLGRINSCYGNRAPCFSCS